MREKRSRRTHLKEFKTDCVKHLIKSGKTSVYIAKELGILPESLSRWRREYEDTEKEAFTGNGNVRDQELYDLRKELVNVKEERDILKKATAIFSKTQL